MFVVIVNIHVHQSSRRSPQPENKKPSLLWRLAEKAFLAIPDGLMPVESGAWRQNAWAPRHIKNEAGNGEVRMRLFTIAGIALMGLCLVASPAWSESVPVQGTRYVVTHNPPRGEAHYISTFSGSSNAFGNWSCTGKGDVRYDSAERCGSTEVALGFVYADATAECVADELDYPFSIQFNDPVVCHPRSCFSPDHFGPRVGCTYSGEWIGTVTGGNGRTQGFRSGAVTFTETYTILEPEEKADGTIVVRHDTMLEGMLDVDFIEEAPSQNAAIEIPAPGSTMSGIGVISGWSCLSGELEADILDAGEVVGTVALSPGSPRADTEGVCGDSDNGFSTTVNWNLYGQGAKTIRLVRNGEEAISNSFSILRLSEDEFLRGKQGSAVVSDFPTEGQETLVEWSESRQGFAPTSVRDAQ